MTEIGAATTLMMSWRSGFVLMRSEPSLAPTMANMPSSRG
jgi:hypothetical protein